MIKKAYEISCDHCGGAEPDFGNRADLVWQWKAHGWIFIGDKHFDSNACAEAYAHARTLGLPTERSRT